MHVYYRWQMTEQVRCVLLQQASTFLLHQLLLHLTLLSVYVELFTLKLLDTYTHMTQRSFKVTG